MSGAHGIYTILASYIVNTYSIQVRVKGEIAATMWGHAHTD